jgi:Protein of unknown function (DUF3592)
MTTAPLSQRRRGGQQMSVGCMAVFFGLFFLVGAALFYFLFIRPVGLLIEARSWREVPCTILSSQVASHSDSDGTTYSVDIAFAYRVNGAEMRSNRYDFNTGSSSGYDGKKAVVDRYPPGSETVCYVDPEDPQRAVLSRDFSATYLIGLFPLLFLFAGLGGLIWVVPWPWKKKGGVGVQPTVTRDGTTVSSAVSPFGVEVPADPSSPMVLKPQATPFVKFVVILLVTLFWNGIVSIFVWQVYKGWKAGSPDGCLTAFMIPFVLIGLLFLFGVFRQLLVLFNPRPHLTLSPGSPAMGESAWLQWRLSGRAAGVKRLRISLEGREEATYRRGTDTHTDRNVFATVPIVDSTEPFEMASGSASFVIPADTMPSFKADRNKIVWTLKVAAEIPGWPDSDDDFEILVRPGRTRG